MTADWCRKHGIPIEVVVQHPGDAVYVGPSVTHQDINVGVGFAQAVNVGGPIWRPTARYFQPCDCKGCSVKYIFTDRRFFFQSLLLNLDLSIPVRSKIVNIMVTPQRISNTI